VQLVPNDTIAAGSKSLQFLEVVKPKKGGAAASEQGQEGSASSASSGKAGSGPDAPSAAEEAAGITDTGNTTADARPQAAIIEEEAANATRNGSADASSAAETSSSGSSSSSGSIYGSRYLNSTRRSSRNGTRRRIEEDNAGAAVFLYTDSARGISQKFAFNLRYYIGAEGTNAPKNGSRVGLSQFDRRMQSGLFSFAANGTTKYSQRSFKYGEVNMKRSRKRRNKDTAEFLLIYEQKYGLSQEGGSADSSSSSSSSDSSSSSSGSADDAAPLAQKIRATVRIDLNSVEDFVKFHVSTNEVPIALDDTGKDIVVDWYMMDDFDSDGKLWVDANGLQMVPKTLN
jgi:hypothetical protein